MMQFDVGSSLCGKRRLLGLAATMLVALAAASPVIAESPEVDATTVSSITAKGMPADARFTVEEKQVRFLPHRSPLRGDGISISVISPDNGDATLIELPGLEGLSFNMICRGEDNSRNACGSRARVQLHNFLVRQEITCLFAAPASQAMQIVSCDVKGQDLGEWLVRHGVARPTDARSYAAAQREAHANRSGMWADAETRKSLLVASN
jgi:endonuclease YncB( thermonuclease family)